MGKKGWEGVFFLSCLLFDFIVIVVIFFFYNIGI